VAQRQDDDLLNPHHHPLDEFKCCQVGNVRDMATLMSKGLGHVGRAILAAFEDEPDNAFTTEELCERAYPSTAKYLPERAQRVAVLRAVKRLTALRPDLGIRDWRSEFARGGGSYFTASIASCVMRWLASRPTTTGSPKPSYALNSCPAAVTMSTRNQTERGCATPRWKSPSATATTRSSNS
jgi:hypothetical protein